MNEWPAPDERYVDIRELAALMGVSTSTVKRLLQAGMPSETWGLHRTRRFLPSQCLTWAKSRTGPRSTVESSRPRPHKAAGHDNRRE
jgi:hypothetical protein